MIHLHWVISLSFKHSTGASHPSKCGWMLLSLLNLFLITSESSRLLFEDGNEDRLRYKAFTLVLVSATVSAPLYDKQDHSILIFTCADSSLSLWFPGWGAVPALVPGGGRESPWGSEKWLGLESLPWETTLAEVVVVSRSVWWVKNLPCQGRAWARTLGTSISPASAGRLQLKVEWGRKACRGDVEGVDGWGNCRNPLGATMTLHLREVHPRTTPPGVVCGKAHHPPAWCRSPASRPALSSAGSPDCSNLDVPAAPRNRSSPALPRSRCLYLCHYRSARCLVVRTPAGWQAHSSSHSPRSVSAAGWQESPCELGAGGRLGSPLAAGWQACGDGSGFAAPLRLPCEGDW